MQRLERIIIIYTLLLGCYLGGYHLTVSSQPPTTIDQFMTIHSSTATTPLTSPHQFRVMDPFISALPMKTYESIIRDAIEEWHAGRLQSRLQPDPSLAPNTPPTPHQLRLAELAANEGMADATQIPPPPASWDPRQNGSIWQGVCPSLDVVRDQGDCDADWASAVAAAFSDRLCIQTNGSIAEDVSTQDILSCCGWGCGLGCNGGYSTKGWNYLVESGAVSGGAFNTTGAAGGCLPYSMPPCHRDINGTVTSCDAIPGVSQTPICLRLCQNGNEWELEKHYTYPPYQVSNDTLAIQAEIYYNGSVTATMDLYQSFKVYTSATYSPLTGEQRIGSIAVKLLGYGQFAGVNYWLGAPAWGHNWGINGFVWITQHQCNVENAVVGAQFRRVI